jgi:hypothetical protein
LQNKSGSNIGIGFTGDDQFPDLEILKLDSIFWGWRLRPMVETGRDEFLQVIGVEIGCMRRCIAMDSPIKPNRSP